jgi:tRNA(Ile)-lysidine synthase TilS/MesJ
MQVLSRWKSAFQGFLQKGTAKTPEALAGCTLLWLAYYTTRINLAVSYTKDECCYDEQLPSLKKIVEQAEAYRKYSCHSSLSQLPRNPNGKLAGSMPSLKPKKTDFKLHSTVCYPLYYTALKYRYKPLRQLALAMLRNADSEGADMLASIARICRFCRRILDRV